MKIIFICLLVLVQILNFSPSFACMGFARPGVQEYPFPNDEVALIIWDQKNSTQHFIRQAKFSGKAKDFAFIVPVPSTPELEEAPKELLSWIYDRMYQTNSGEGFGGGGLGTKGRGGSGAVEVVKEQEVAGMNAVVIRSTDSEALQKWLSENGYAVPKEAVPWIQHYVQQKWEFVAFKIKSSSNTPIDTRAGVSSPLVRISFKTSRIVYPYRESALRKRIPDREFSLFVIAPTKLVGSYESIKPWKTYLSNSKPYSEKSSGTHPLNDVRLGQKRPSSKLTGLDEYLKKLLKRSPSAEPLFISHFRNNEEFRPYDEDLYFDPLVKH